MPTKHKEVAADHGSLHQTGHGIRAVTLPASHVAVKRPTKKRSELLHHTAVEKFPAQQTLEP